MKLTVNRLELLSAAQDAEKIAPASSPVEALCCTRLAAADGKLSVGATSLEVALERRLPAQIEEDGVTLINAKLLTGMLRLLDGDTVSISADKTRVDISGGNAAYNLAAQNLAMFPRMEIPFPEDAVTVTGIPAMARRTVFAASEDNNKPLMKCVQLRFTADGLKAVVSDGQRIASANGDEKSTGSAELLIPAASLEKLAHLVGGKDELRVGTTGKAVVLTKENFAFSARLMEGRYFNAEQLLSRVQPAFTVLTDADAMRNAVTMATAASGQKTRFCIKFDGSKLLFRCESEYGKSSAELDVVALSGTPDGEYWYIPDKLLECLRAQNGTMTLDVAQNGALVMRTDELLCLQMAIRAPGAITVTPPKPIKKEPPKPKEKKPKKTKAAAEPAAA